jgi:hypothetical protein
LIMSASPTQARIHEANRLMQACRPAAFMVLFAMAIDKGVVGPAVLSRRTGLNSETVRTALARLAELGYAQNIGGHDGWCLTADAYQLPIPLGELDGETAENPHFGPEDAPAGDAAGDDVPMLEAGAQDPNSGNSAVCEDGIAPNRGNSAVSPSHSMVGWSINTNTQPGNNQTNQPASASDVREPVAAIQDQPAPTACDDPAPLNRPNLGQLAPTQADLAGSATGEFPTGPAEPWLLPESDAEIARNLQLLAAVHVGRTSARTWIARTYSWDLLLRQVFAWLADCRQWHGQRPGALVNRCRRYHATRSEFAPLRALGAEEYASAFYCDVVVPILANGEPPADGDVEPPPAEPPDASDNPGPSAPSDLWQLACQQLALQTAKGTYETWLRDTSLVETAGDRCVVSCPNAGTRDWLAVRLHPLIKRTLSAVAGRPLEVVFVMTGEEG